MSGILLRGLKQGLQTTWTLGKVIFPITLIITILQFTPVLPWVIDKISPLMGLVGLSGEAAVPIVLGNVLNLYAGIAAIISFDFTVKEVFIMAIMLSFSHNLIIESAVASKVGIKWWIIVGVRIGLALVAAIVINLVWNGGGEIAQYGFISKEPTNLTGWTEIGLHGVTTAFIAVVQLAIIVIPLMIIMQYLREKGWLTKLSNGFAPITKLLGMEKNTSMTLVAGLTIGLAYGAGLMIQAVKEDGVSKKDMTLALIFLVSCHAVVEDTLIFIPLGIPVWPLLVMRLVTAIVLTMTIAYFWNRSDQRKRKEITNEHSYHTI
ncbi:nucleoside recognition domain-containing protein [Ornithinibacillus sp. BX22]|uniref:Nucleoside recognition domain-containing protein n=2 Tax=Ornithinibacillus TaxID=484508 RepID=A0A923L7G4_9BACI|nr:MULTISPECIES: nucleoside recognition domain-containing protein [Ornithinibacillus]MBC5637873.1 nucleoside recognition domain-containing protein [Ornithinibacillus hominis]MBS3681764.1 nucleoside recognition domain-containing protein [Ornithinibacillus massiliensis]